MRILLSALLTIAALLAASAPVAQAEACTVGVADARGLAVVGCALVVNQCIGANCTQREIASGWVAVFYDCWYVGTGQRVLGIGTYAYGVTENQVGLPLIAPVDSC